MVNERAINAYDIVRIVALNAPGRDFRGTTGVARAPAVGDQGTVVFAYSLTDFAVECVDHTGATLWLADFSANELEIIASGDPPVR